MNEENDQGANAAAVQQGSSASLTDAASHAEIEEFFRILSWRGYGRIAYDAQMARIVRTVREEALRDAIALVKARGDVENHIVAPGMWFAAGWIRHCLLEPLIGSGSV